MQKTINVKVEGFSPLLMNRFRAAQISDKSKKRTGVMAEEDVRDKLYLDKEGKPYIPGVYFYGALVEAGKQFKITGKGKATFSKLIGSTVMVGPECISLDGDFESYSIPAVNPMTKGRMIVTRPRFDKWSCSFKIILQDEGINPAVINEVLEYAGRYVGVGDWRPAKKGMFGKFIVTEFKEVK